MSAGQRDRILKLRQAHLLKIEGIVRKRKDIVWELQQATVMPESASSRHTAFVKVCQLLLFGIFHRFLSASPICYLNYYIRFAEA